MLAGDRQHTDPNREAREAQPEAPEPDAPARDDVLIAQLPRVGSEVDRPRDSLLEEVVDHYIEFFKRVKANAPPGVVSPVASTDGINFDRQPSPEEREALLAYLRKL